MRRRPRIGINCGLVGAPEPPSYKLDRRYADAVRRAGGDPVLMPFFHDAAGARSLLDVVDGVLLTGGTDINPRRWGERRHPAASRLLPERETSDFLLLEAALARDLPVLGICAGCQELNVVLGGSLHQHVDDLPGAGPHSDGARHEVMAFVPSMIRDILGRPRATVNSFHHQACRRPGRGLTVSAVSPDGLIEAVESVRHRFVLGVQWHPERMPGYARQRAVFRALIAAADVPAVRGSRIFRKGRQP